MSLSSLTKLRRVAVMLLICLAVTALPAAAQRLVPKVNNIIFFADHSGSMAMTYKGLPGNYTKIVMAKQAMVEINYRIPNLSYNSGVFTFAPLRQFSPVAPFNQTVVHDAIGPIGIEYEIYGRLTPMGPDLLGLDPVLAQLSGRTALIMFTDGYDNIGIDAVAAARQLQNKYGDRLCIMVVSFADTDRGREQVKKLASLSPCGCLIEGEELLNSRAAEDTFLRCALYAEEMRAATGEVVVFRSIYFDFDKSNIKREFIPVLDEGVSIAKSKNERVILEGHTDSVGTLQYNQRLSERRANSVKSYFVRKGVPSGSITAVGYGKTRPQADNATAEGRRLNRRVEIKFQP